MLVLIIIIIFVDIHIDISWPDNLQLILSFISKENVVDSQ